MWDEADQSLLLARDRHGIKPLYWRAEARGGLSWSSELTPLLDPHGANIDPDAVREFLRFGSPVTQPIAHGVIEIAPGTVMRVARSGIEITSFIDDDRHDVTSPIDALRESITQHARADRSVALFLSGGFDSAAVLAGLSEAGALPLCLTLRTADNHAEVERARRTARHYGADHEVVAIDETQLDGQIDGFLRAMDQPSVDGFNTYLISEICRSFDCPVALSGLGGDEVLGGYRYYRTENG